MARFERILRLLWKAGTEGAMRRWIGCIEFPSSVLRKRSNSGVFRARDKAGAKSPDLYCRASIGPAEAVPLLQGLPKGSFPEPVKPGSLETFVVSACAQIDEPGQEEGGEEVEEPVLAAEVAG